MDDDIDIEEHDLMDNPTVRSIFPDLSVLKKELLQYDYAPDVKPDPVTVVTNNSHKLTSFESDNSNNTSVVPSKKKKDSPYLLKEARYNDKLTQGKGQKNHVGRTFNQSIIVKPKPKNIVRTQIKQKLQIKNEKYKCLKRLVFESHNVIKMPDNNERDESLNIRANPNGTKTTLMNVQTIGKNKNSFEVENGRIINPCIMKSHRALTSKHFVNVLSSINDDTNGRGMDGRGSKNNLNGNKIILGSKPSKLPEHTQESYVNHFIPYVAKVTLQDVSSYLHESKRYCADCLILFPNNNVYDVHKAMLHASNLDAGNKLKKYKNKPIHKCEQCQIYFTTFENSEKHRKTFHNDQTNFDATNIVNKSDSKLQNKATHSLSSNNSCFHCLKIFKDQKSLIEHLYNVLEPKKKENNMTEKTLKILLDEKYVNEKIMNSQKIHTPEKSLVERTSRKENNYYQRTRLSFQNLYSCPICSQYFKSVRFFKRHMAQKHKVKQMSKLKKVRFDPKCRFCSVKTSNCITYNKHLLRRHRNQNELQRIMKNQPKVIISKIRTPAIKPLKSNIEHHDDQSNGQNINGWKPFAMKSVLFKCNKCDINFLSAKDAVLHVEHMEMLVNWKCFTCTRIFKDRDVALHIKQHTFSDYFEVYDLGESALNRVLYCCSKCAIHFTEDRYLSHYPICEFETADSAYCDLCDILVDKSSMRFHKYCHKYNKFKSTDFTVIETSIILEKDLCIKKQDVNSASKIVDSENHMRVDKKCHSYIIPKKAKLGMKKENLCVDESSSSETISKKAKFDVQKINKSGDTNGSNKTKKKSEINNSLILSYCQTCKCFLSKLGPNREVHIQSRCAHIVKYICKYCGIMTTQKATQSHKLLHRKQKHLKLQDFKFYDLISKKQICPPIPEFPNCEICGIHFISKVAKISHECSEDDYLTCQICHTKLSEAAFKLHMLFHNYSIKNKTHNPHSVNAPKSGEIKTISSFTTSLTSSKVMTDLNEILPIIYSCTDCFIAMETYDKVIEHCQDHSARKKSLSPLLKCNTCSIKFDRSSYETHKELHDNNTDSKSAFKILSFDPIYFTSENKIWTKHILGTLPIEQSSMILNKSIYKFEGRLKMEVIQDGPSNLTVYKCDRCRSFIDPILVYKHAENSCFKQRKHPCSHCGLPFISTATRVEHEKIHKDPNIRLKSYRIVIFNREGDIAFNNLIFINQNIYVLYQCRNCNVLVNKSKYEKHKCVIESLRKCLQCGLLLYKEDFKCHMSKHKDLVKFNRERIKVILLGNKIEPKNNTILDLQSSFTGTICDYTFYKCSNCEISLKNEDQKIKHKCCNSTSNSKCPSCGLIFLKEKLKYHLKLHGNDIDFIRDNMNIITFDANTASLQTSSTILNEFETKNLEQNSSNDITKTTLLENKYHKNIVDTNVTSHDRTITENVANIYKCLCGLHFVNERCARTHHNICNPRIRASKQNCSKCDLLFTPSDLFDHLIMHHGDKKIAYEFNIINIFKETTRIVYKCSKCQLHFSSANEANIHFDQCYEKGTDGKECKNCSLKFYFSSFHEVCSSNFIVEVISKN